MATDPAPRNPLEGWDAAPPGDRVSFPDVPNPLDTFRADLIERAADLIRSAIDLQTQRGIFERRHPPRWALKRAAAIQARAERFIDVVGRAEALEGAGRKLADLTGELDGIGRRIDPKYNPRSRGRKIAFEMPRAVVFADDAYRAVALALQLEFPALDPGAAHGYAVKGVKQQRGRWEELAADRAADGRKSGEVRRETAKKEWWNLAKRLYRSGTSIHGVARACRKSRSAVQNALDAMGLRGADEHSPQGGSTKQHQKADVVLPRDGRGEPQTATRWVKRNGGKRRKPMSERVRAVRAWVSAQTVRNALWRLGLQRFLYGSVAAVRRWGTIPADRPTRRQIAIQYRRPLADVLAEAAMPRSLDDPWGRKGSGDVSGMKQLEKRLAKNKARRKSLLETQARTKAELAKLDSERARLKGMLEAVRAARTPTPG